MSLTGKNNEEKIWNKLIAAGMTPCGAAGSMGNQKAESGLNPKNLQNSFEKKLGYTDATYTAAVDNRTYTNFANDRAGYGLCQWTYHTRKAALLAFTKAAGKSVGDLEAQIDFYIKELKESYPKVWAVLTTAKSVREASDAVLLQFERPADQSESNRARRAKYGQAYYDKYAGKETQSMSFTPRLARPEAGNKYYITKAAGGYSDAIKGSPTDTACNVLSNCVGYAYGRFNEIVGEGCCKYLRPVNAENFIEHAGGLEIGQEPRLGACAVWQKGNTLKGSDGAGHVAIVEKIVSATEIITSESGWNAKKPFWTQTRKKGNGNWGQGSGYKFLGFIYNPAACCQGTAPAKTTAPVQGAPAKTEAARHIDRALAGAYRTTADLNLRTGAGTNKAVLTVIPKGGTVRNYGYYNTVGGKKWLYVQYSAGGKTYTGYCSMAYLKK